MTQLGNERHYIYEREKENLGPITRMESYAKRSAKTVDISEKIVQILK